MAADVLYLRHQRDFTSDSSLRSITPDIVRSRLTLFSNVLVDQTQALAIHSVCKTCSVRKGFSRFEGDCGSIHFGFCRAAEEHHTEESRKISEKGVQHDLKQILSVKQARLDIPVRRLLSDRKSAEGYHLEKDQLASSFNQTPVADDGSGDTPVIKIPPFYFPLGRPNESAEEAEALKKAVEFFNKKKDRIQAEQSHELAKAMGLPAYWGILLYNAAASKTQGHVTAQNFINVWKGVVSSCFDDAARFVKLASRSGKNWLEPDDMVPLIQDVVDHHPGLQFLHEAVEFHSRYVHCVISRIFYTVNRTWSGKITISELRRSNFLQVLSLLEEEDDINQITDYFSYEHFYVIYCKFWELDKDHDLFIDKDDLTRHNEHALSSRIIERIFSGAVTRGKQEGKMSYTEFVVFLLSEEDKRTARSIEYWFRCMDLDGDGYLSMFEMEYFYEEQISRMEEMGIEPLPFTDILCQMLDMIEPVEKDKISLADLKNCKQAYIFFDAMFHLEKYLDHEQRDPFANTKDEMDAPEPSDWEKYAAEEYELLVAEESAEEEQQGSFDYEDDFDGEAEEEAPEISNNVGSKRERPRSAKSLGDPNI